MINIAFFSAKSYDEASFNKIKNNRNFEFHYHDFRLTEKTAKMAHGCDVVCAFVNDDLSAPVLKQLSLGGTKLIAKPLKNLAYKWFEFQLTHQRRWQSTQSV
jgi:D-lactate dehydrogenase